MPHADVTDAVFQDQVANSLLSDSERAQEAEERGEPDAAAERFAQRPNSNSNRGGDMGEEILFQEEVADSLLGEHERQADEQQKYEEGEPADEMAAHEKAFAEALENFDALEPGEQAEVVHEFAGRGYEATAQLIDPNAAKELTAGFFETFGREDLGEAVNPALFGGFLSFWGDRVVETMEQAGLNQLDYEKAAELNKPEMCARFTQDFFEAMAAPELAAEVDPQIFAAYWTAWAPTLLSGRAMGREDAQRFTQDFFTAFGEPEMANIVNPSRFAQQWSGLGFRLGHTIWQGRQQASRTAQQKQSGSGVRWNSNRDLFDEEGQSLYHLQHGRL